MRRGLCRIVKTCHSNMDSEHGNHNEKSLRVIPSAYKLGVMTCVRRVFVQVCGVLFIVL